MNRFILSFLFFILLLPIQAQRSKAELQAYVDTYKPGNVLDLDSYLISIEGDTILFSEFQGKWVLIDYWTVGCKPCLKELPFLVEFSQSSNLDQLEVIAVSVDTDLDRWRRLSEKRVKALPNFFNISPHSQLNSRLFYLRRPPTFTDGLKHSERNKDLKIWFCPFFIGVLERKTSNKE